MKAPDSQTETPAGALRALHLTALWAFAGAQPLFSLIAANADFLVAHRLRLGEIVALTALVSLAAPILLASAERLASAVSRRLDPAVYSLLAGALTGLFLLQAWRGLRQAPAPVAATAFAAVTGLVAWGIARSASARVFLTLLAPGILLFPALFLLHSPVAGLLRPKTVESVAGPGVETTTPLVMIVFDELPLSSLLDGDRHINRHRFPSFAALAETSHWLRNASTVAQTTTFAVPAIVTGRHPDRSRVANAAAYPRNLFTWLAPSHRLAVFESLTRLCPEELCRDTAPEASSAGKVATAALDLAAVYLHRVLPRDLALRLPQVDASWRDFWTPAGAAPGDGEAKAKLGDVRAQTARFLASIAPSSRSRRPTLYFLHLNLPHVPWRFLPSGREYGPRNLTLLPHGVEAETWTGSEWETVQGFQRHLLQVGFADRLLGEVMEALEEAGIRDESLVIVTADHGVAFRRGAGRRRVDPERPSDIMQVPLFVKAPGQKKGSISDRNAETVDILSTIAGVLGTSPPWAVDGVSLLDPETRERPVKVLATNKGHDFAARLSFPPDLAGLDETVIRMLEIFGDGSDPESLYRVGPRALWIGRRPAEAAPVGVSPLGVEITGGTELEAVDTLGIYLPVHLAGRLFPEATGRSPAVGLELAVAVNGTLRATTRSFEAAGGDVRFTAMIPESSLVDGRNTVEIFEIATGPLDDGPGLDLIRRSGEVSYSLIRGAEGIVTHLASSDGRRFPLVPGLLRGEVVQTSLDFRGRALGGEPPRPADAVVFFADGRPVTLTRPRPLKASGGGGTFAFVVPYGLLDGGAKIRFIGLLGDQAAELPYREQ